jgi:hypothetical protein
LNEECHDDAALTRDIFIDGSALLVHPFSSDWYVGGSVFVSGRGTSIVEITRFQLHPSQ